MEVARIVAGLCRVDRELNDAPLTGEFADVVLQSPACMLEGELVRQGDDDALGDLGASVFFCGFGRVPEPFDVLGAAAPIGRSLGCVQAQEQDLLPAAELGMPSGAGNMVRCLHDWGFAEVVDPPGALVLIAVAGEIGGSPDG
jgi:hypothetical protein